MKKKISLVLLCFAIAFCLCTCSGEGYKNYSENSNFVSIDGSKDLYYYSETKIVYIIFSECGGNQGYGYLAPYYSENGKLCRYIDGQIVEITEESDLNE